MKTIFNMTATEVKQALTQKGIDFEYTIGDYDNVWIGFRNKSVYNWIQFIDEKTTGVFDAQMYSQNTGKTSKGFETRQKVYNRFDKIINN